MVTEIQRFKCLQKYHELKKIDAYNKREYKRLLADARVFIEEDKNNQVNELTDYVDGYCRKMDDVAVPFPVYGSVISELDIKRFLLHRPK